MARLSFLTYFLGDLALFKAIVQPIDLSSKKPCSKGGACNFFMDKPANANLRLVSSNCLIRARESNLVATYHCFWPAN